jgi:membrane protease YdiL (CAAX protease family)
MNISTAPGANQMLDTKRIALFLALGYGIAWAFGLIIYLTGGLANSPQLIPGTPITLALVLLAGGYMWAPALAHALTRLFTREGWRAAGLRPRLAQVWPYWLAGWFVPALMTILGAALFFAVFPQFFDASLGTLSRMLDQSAQRAGQAAPFGPWALVAIQTIAGILLAPLINSLFTFGEEFGWRAYLLPKLLPLGERTALVTTGVIWGVWHWPVIAMGHNYGLSYPGAPWAGMLAMVWFTLATGMFLGRVALRADSVWPAVIGHAAINGISGLGALFVRGEPNPLFGPLPTGLIASLPWTALALWIFLRAERKT